ncbi:hypothetical protein ACHAXN_001679 [Cyclotella atomus]
MAKLFKSPAVIILLSSRSSVSGLIPWVQRVTSPYSIAAAAVRSPSLAISRRSLLITTMAVSSSSLLPAPFDKGLQQAITLLDSIYSPVDSSDFPLPMSPEEAGPCKCTSNATPQRRYLWTDAFAVLAYQTISNIYSAGGHVQEANIYKDAADKLIDTVHNCLGKPRSGREEDAMKPCKMSPTGYVGMRIGKVESQIDTDYGMRCDGQYFHYIDKWLFALSRTGHIEDGLRIAKSIFPYFFSKADHSSSGGIRWKLSVNASPPKALPPTHGPNDDTLNALVVYTMLESQRIHLNDCMPSLSLESEIQMLQESLKHYHPHVTDDPLGWGLEAIFDQFVEGHPRTRQLRHLASDALCTSHISLPFRLYGALIGATVSSHDLVSADYLQRVKDFCIKHQFREVEKSASSNGKYREDFSEINRVMLAVALLGPKSTLSHNENDPMIKLDVLC